MFHKYHTGLLALLLTSAAMSLILCWRTQTFEVPITSRPANEKPLSCSKAATAQQQVDVEKQAFKQENGKFTGTTFGSTEWRKYLPDVAYLLSEIEKGTVEMPENRNKTTDAAHTELLVSRVSGFEVGNIFEGYIQARDHQGRNKTYGADYFRARLMRLVNEKDDLSYDGVSVALLDERNGRYKFKTRIPWSGRSKLIIELMHPSEAVVDLISKITPTSEEKVSFLGTFPSGHKAHCDVMLRSKDVCNFSEPENGIRWVCVRPINQSCPRELKWWEKRIFEDIPALMSGSWFSVGVNYQAKINGSGLVVHSKKSMNRTSTHLPSCMTFAQKAYENSVSGYFENGVWHSTNCNNAIKSLTSARRCLRDKTVYFIGDSTVRQWHLELVSFLKLRDQTFGNSTVSWSVSRRAKDLVNNFVMEYRAHGSPLRNPGSRKSRPPIVETLNKISNADGKDIIVIFNIGAHFVLHDPEVLLERLSAIKRALVNLRKRLPNVKLFVKGAVRTRALSMSIPSEWVVYRSDRILRQFFAGIPYIDTWSMTTVQPQKSVHAERTMIRHFISLFVSHICEI